MKTAQAVIASDRLLALNWPHEDQHIGMLKIGRRLGAWRNLKGLCIAYNGDVIFRISARGDRLLIKPSRVMSLSQFYGTVREASDVLGLGRVELCRRHNRLTAEHNDILYLGDLNGEIAIPLKSA